MACDYLSGALYQNKKKFKPTISEKKQTEIKTHSSSKGRDQLAFFLVCGLSVCVRLIQFFKPDTTIC